MEVLVGVLAVAGVLGVFTLALWRWREYQIGHFAGGGGRSGAGAGGGADSWGEVSSSPAIDPADPLTAGA